MRKAVRISLILCALAGLFVTFVGAEEGTLGDAQELAWRLTETGELTVTGNLPNGHAVCAACYDSQGRFTGAKLLTAEKTTAQLDGAYRCKLLWLDDAMAPQCAPAETTVPTPPPPVTPGEDTLIFSYAADSADIYRLYQEYTDVLLEVGENGYTNFQAYNTYLDETSNQWMIKDEYAGVLGNDGNIVAAGDYFSFKPIKNYPDMYETLRHDQAGGFFHGLYDLSKKREILPCDYSDLNFVRYSVNGDEYIQVSDSSETVYCRLSTGKVFHLPAGAQVGGYGDTSGTDDYLVGYTSFFSDDANLYPAEGVTVTCPVSDCSDIWPMGNGLFRLEKKSPETRKREMGFWVAGSPTMALDMGPYKFYDSSDLNDRLYLLYKYESRDGYEDVEYPGLWSAQTQSFIFPPEPEQDIWRMGDLLLRSGGSKGGIYRLDGTPIREDCQPYTVYDGSYIAVNEGGELKTLYNLDGAPAFPTAVRNSYIIDGKLYGEVEGEDGKVGVIRADGTTVIPAEYVDIHTRTSDCYGAPPNSLTLFLAQTNSDNVRTYEMYLPSGKRILSDPVLDATCYGNYVLAARRVHDIALWPSYGTQDYAVYYIDPETGTCTVVTDKQNSETSSYAELVGENLLFRNTLYTPTGEVLAENCTLAEYIGETLYCQSKRENGAGETVYSVSYHTESGPVLILDHLLPLKFADTGSGAIFYDDNGTVFNAGGQRLASNLGELCHAAENLFYLRIADTPSEITVFKIAQDICTPLSIIEHVTQLSPITSASDYWELYSETEAAVVTAVGDIAVPPIELEGLDYGRLSFDIETYNNTEYVEAFWPNADPQRHALYYAGSLALPAYDYLRELYSEASSAEFRAYLIRPYNSGAWGIYDAQFNNVIPCEYDNISLISAPDGVEYFKLEKGGKYGAATLSGDICIPAEHDYINFGNNCIVTWDGDTRTLCCFVDGVMTPLCTGRYIGIIGNLATCDSLDGTKSLYYTPTGELLRTADVMSAPYGSVCVRVYDDTTYTTTYIGQNGQAITSAPYSWYSGDFSEGLAYVSVWVSEIEPHNRFGFINENGKEIIPLRYKAASDFTNGKSWVMTEDEKWAIIKSPLAP